jgi:hypothetical protein
MAQTDKFLDAPKGVRLSPYAPDPLNLIAVLGAACRHSGFLLDPRRRRRPHSTCPRKAGHGFISNFLRACSAEGLRASCGHASLVYLFLGRGRLRRCGSQGPTLRDGSLGNRDDLFS